MMANLEDLITHFYRQSIKPLFSLLEYVYSPKVFLLCYYLSLLLFEAVVPESLYQCHRYTIWNREGKSISVFENRDHSGKKKKLIILFTKTVCIIENENRFFLPCLWSHCLLLKIIQKQTFFTKDYYYLTTKVRRTRTVKE